MPASGGCLRLMDSRGSSHAGKSGIELCRHPTSGPWGHTIAANGSELSTREQSNHMSSADGEHQDRTGRALSNRLGERFELYHAISYVLIFAGIAVATRK
jgi:hypothetical protein